MFTKWTVGTAIVAAACKYGLDFYIATMEIIRNF